MILGALDSLDLTDTLDSFLSCFFTLDDFPGSFHGVPGVMGDLPSW
jgi:hypothetical protein